MSAMQSHTRTMVRQRMWVAVEPPAWSFWWRGAVPAALLATLLLFAVTRFASSWIERTVDERTEAQLRQAGLGWVQVTADGQNVHLRGAPPSAAEADRAIALAHDTRCDTWAGARDCTRRVTSSFAFAAPAAPVTPAITAAPRWHDLTATIDGGVLTLRGEIPDEAARGRLIALARPHAREVRDELAIGAGPAMPSWETVADRVVDTASRCQRGAASLTAGTYAIRCDVRSADKELIAKRAGAAMPTGELGAVMLVAVEEAQACDKDLARLLRMSTIQFASGSAVIAATSQPLLQQIATVASRCPGNLQVLGHTDNVGDPAKNLSLSQARAEAVRAALTQLGVDGTRLLPRGLGQTQPRAANTTPAGRAQNRRIEFRTTSDAQ